MRSLSINVNRPLDENNLRNSCPYKEKFFVKRPARPCYGHVTNCKQIFNFLVILINFQT